VTFEPDQAQSRVLEHVRGPFLVTGPAGTGKTAVLQERLARLIEGGSDPERVVLVVGSRQARVVGRSALMHRLRASLPGLRILTPHGLAYQVVSDEHAALGYEGPPEILSAPDQFAKVHQLLLGEDGADWPAYGDMLRLRGFADQVRQFLLRAQEALLKPEDIMQRATDRGLTAWEELARFYRKYLQVLDSQGAVDFAGLVEQAAAAALGKPPLYDHVLVDDYHDTTFGVEALVAALNARSLVVAGDPEGHVFSFQGTTDAPIRQFTKRFLTAGHVTLEARHRGAGPAIEAWYAQHSSEEHASLARELRRIHVQDGVPWSDLAVVVRRQGSELHGLLRVLDDAVIPRWMPERAITALADPAPRPYLLALRWAARPGERASLVEPLLISDATRIPPAMARGMLRGAATAGDPPEQALAHTAGLDPGQALAVQELRETLDQAEKVADRSVMDAFSLLWRRLPCSARLVDEAERSERANRDLDAITAFGELVSRAEESTDPSVEAFLADLEAGHDGPGWAGPAPLELDAVAILTAHASVGREFDTVLVAGASEGNFPSLSRPEPMFDLSVLERAVPQSERNRLRLADERRLFRMVVGRAARRVLFASSDAGEEPGSTGRSRFVEEWGAEWKPAPDPGGAEPLTAAEARAGWRRILADSRGRAHHRLASLEGLVALRADPTTWWFQRDWTDTGRRLHDEIRTSYSRLDRLENCELQFVLSEELGLGKPSGYHAWVGSLVHGLIQQYEEGTLAGRSLEDLVQAAQERWRQDEFPSFAVSEAFRRLVTETMLPNWFREYERTGSLAREIRFEFDYEGARITGYIDRIGPITSGGNRITDFKTGKVENAGKAEENLQLGIYYLAVSECEDLAPYRPVRAVELAFLRGKRKDGSRVEKVPWQWSSSSEPAYRQEMSDRLSALIGRLRTLYETEVYRPNTAADCHWCDFKTLCPLWPEGAPVFPEPSREVPAP
jgi:superfamily I DNA/RNA helicase/RecB family exonuclease